MIITDLASDILISEAKDWNLRLVKTTSRFHDCVFDTNSHESFDQFYNMLETSKELPISSQPSPSEYVALYEEAKEKGEDVLVICVSSKLSGTYNSAMLAKSMIEYENIYVVDSLQATVSLRMLVMYALHLQSEGMSIKDIYETMIEKRNKIQLYGVPENLVYLKKGGRVPPVLANIADTLKLKPILTIEDGVIESIKNVRGFKSAMNYMLEACINDQKRDNSFPLFISHSHDVEKADKFEQMVHSKNQGIKTSIYEIGPAIGTHVGPHGIIIAYFTR